MWRRQLPLVLLLLASPAVLVAQEPTGPSEPPPAEAPDEATPASDEETTRSPWWGSRAAEGAPVPSAEATVQALRALHWKNRLEVTLARQALARADRAAVRRLAEQAVLDHELVDRRLVELAARLEIDLRPPAAEEHARGEQVQKMLSELTQLSGAEFERAWLRMMVNGHREGIQQLAGLRPRVDAPEVRALLRDVLPLFDQHLAMARALQPDARVGVAPEGRVPSWIRIVGRFWR